MDNAVSSKASAKQKSVIQERKMKSNGSSIGNGQGTATRNPLQEVQDACNIGRIGIHIDDKNNHLRAIINAGKENIIDKDHKESPALASPTDKAKQAGRDRCAKFAEKRQAREVYVNNTGNLSSEDSRRARRERAAIIRRNGPQRRKRATLASVTAMYSASVVDKATVDCKVDFQLTSAFARVNKYPVVDLHLSKSPA
ncbi:hypothetical protein PIB30_096669 [Stylosanthes scabra]|uniref:Uncharacterized protein n=1 Tax=Stylosanthes scabra TaxID=79078 RepID=A0ABU6ZVD2_9FABA|nr:hypothetical protein [Stylosanthes scabra]